MAALQRLPRCGACGSGAAACCAGGHATCCSRGGRCRACALPLAAAAPVARCAQPGCGLSAPLAQLSAHERACPRRPQRCLVAPACAWRGRRADLEAHTQAEHAQQFVRFPGTAGASVSWRISKHGCCVDLTRHLVVALGETFLYQKEFNYQQRQLSVAVQLVGPPERSARFRYRFELSRSEGDHSVTFERAVHSEDEDLQRSCGLGDCVMVPYDTITQFCHGERVLVLCKAKYRPKHELPVTDL